MAINFNEIINQTKHIISKHSPEILIGVGISSMIGSTVLAVKVTPKVIEKIKQSGEKDNIKIIKMVWKDYIPAALLCVNGVACIITSNNISSKRNAALTSAYILSEKALTTYKNKVIETIGEKKEKKIRDEIHQDSLKADPPEDKSIIITSKGNTLMKDSISGRYFRSDINYIQKCILNLCKKMRNNDYISLNELYREIGLEPIKDGDYVGWSINDGYLDISISTCLSPNDEPAIVIDYNRLPKTKFDMSL